MNYINYIQHALYNPDTYHRRFDLDLSDLEQKTKRAALAILPFIGLYQPAGFIMSLGMNSSRFYSHLEQAFESQKKENWKEFVGEAGKAGLAALSLSTTVFHFSSGLAITTASDVLQGAWNTYQAVIQGERSKAIEEALQTLSSSAYLLFMATGALEAMVAFSLIQTATSFYLANGELEKGNYIEASAKAAMGMIRISQVGHYVDLIQKRNLYLQLQRTQSLFLKLLRGKEGAHLIHSPLSSLQSKIEENDIRLANAEGDEIGFGAHFHGHGNVLVKGENLAFRTKVIDGKEVVELDFKINHVFREHLKKSIRDLKNAKPKEISDLLALSGSHATELSIGKGTFFPETKSLWWDLGEAHEIQAKGLGTLLIGASLEEPGLYDRVVVRMDANLSLYHLHELLSLVDLDQALALSSKEDIERLKMGHLFRTFFPKEATPFERTEEFFTLPIDKLKEKMFSLAPEMEEIYNNFYHRMKAESIIGGRIRYRIEGLADAAYDAGARALTAAITGAYEDEELFKRIANILQIGMLSTETRDTYEMNEHGLDGSSYNYLFGGADSVYTQMITKKDCEENLSFYDLQYYSKIRILISLEALEMGSYQYHTDAFGNRIYEEDNWFGFESYATRDGILEFIHNEENSTVLNAGHEIMLKERIAPSFFTGLVVSDEKTKFDLIAYLRGAGLIDNEKILGKTLDQFIQVSSQMSEELIGNQRH